MQAEFSKASSAPLLERWAAALLEEGDWLPGFFFFNKQCWRGTFLVLECYMFKKKKVAFREVQKKKKKTFYSEHAIQLKSPLLIQWGFVMFTN